MCYFSPVLSQALWEGGCIQHCVCLHNGFSRGYEGIKTFNSVLAPAFVDPCWFSLSALARQSFQSSLLYMNFTVTLIHIRFHSNKQITQQSRSDPFPGITRVSLASWLRKVWAHSHPHRKPPSLSYDTLQPQFWSMVVGRAWVFLQS